MNPRINYTLVGGFVVLLSLALFAFIAFMLKDQSQSNRLPYYTYFYDSVSGLNERASVKYRGVPVGYVEKIELITQPDERVRLKLRLDADLALKTNTYASLQHQGITGLLFVELKSLDIQAANINSNITTSEEQPAEIPSQGSRLVEITDNLDTAITNFSELSTSLNKLTNQISTLLAPDMQGKTHELIAALEQLSRTTEERLKAFNPEAYNQLAEKLGESASQLQKGMNKELQQLTQDIGRLIDDAQITNRLVNPLINEANNLLRQLQDEGSSWLRNNQHQPAGPGE